MKAHRMHRVSVLFAAAAMSVGSLTFVATGFATQPAPGDAAKAVDRAADKSIDAAKNAKAAADDLTKSTIVAAPAPACDDICNALAATTEAAVTKGGFNGVVKHLVDADRDRLSSFNSGDEFAKLDGRIASFNKDWKSKYGVDFSFSKNAHAVFGDTFAAISQGEIGSMVNAEGKTVPSSEPKVIAGTAAALKKSGVCNIDANSGKVAGGDTNREIGRSIAAVIIPATAGMPEMAIPMIHEAPSSWQIDLPDNIDGLKLHENLLKHLTMVDEDRANWPADVNEAYRAVTRHVMMAIMESDVAHEHMGK